MQFEFKTLNCARKRCNDLKFEEVNLAFLLDFILRTLSLADNFVQYFDSNILLIFNSNAFNS